VFFLAMFEPETCAALLSRYSHVAPVPQDTKRHAGVPADVLTRPIFDIFVSFVLSVPFVDYGVASCNYPAIRDEGSPCASFVFQ
jgi:hypothetical protein